MNSQDSSLDRAETFAELFKQITVNKLLRSMRNFVLTEERAIELMLDPSSTVREAAKLRLGELNV